MGRECKFEAEYVIVWNVKVTKMKKNFVSWSVHLTGSAGTLGESVVLRVEQEYKPDKEVALLKKNAKEVQWKNNPAIAMIVKVHVQ